MICSRLDNTVNFYLIVLWIFFFRIRQHCKYFDFINFPLDRCFFLAYFASIFQFLKFFFQSFNRQDTSGNVDFFSEATSTCSIDATFSEGVSQESNVSTDTALFLYFVEMRHSAVTFNSKCNLPFTVYVPETVFVVETLSTCLYTTKFLVINNFIMCGRLPRIPVLCRIYLPFYLWA